MIFSNDDGDILLLEPTYKNDWEIPGWIIEENESQKEACEREIYEELWLKKEIGELLCLEYQREEDDSYMFVFDGWMLTQNEIESIKIQENEIGSFEFLSLEEIEQKVLKKMFLRIKKCIESKWDKNTHYYETIYN